MGIEVAWYTPKKKTGCVDMHPALFYKCKPWGDFRALQT